MNNRAENLAYLLPMVRCVRLGTVADLAGLPDDTLEQMVQFIRNAEEEQASRDEQTAEPTMLPGDSAQQ